jgi:hypothetical protein
MSHFPLYVPADLAFDFFGQLKQSIRVEPPVRFYAGREAARWIRVYPDGIDTHLHTFHKGGSGSAEWVEDQLAGLDSKSS